MSIGPRLFYGGSEEAVDPGERKGTQYFANVGIRICSDPTNALFRVQKTLEKNDQPPGEVPATIGQEGGRIYEHKLSAEMDNKYTIDGCDRTRNKERTHCRGRSLDQGEYLQFPCPYDSTEGNFLVIKR